jgi:2-polyprenyl-6-methoxyphenol hydroxylase-like FAD-dependent oxidoreductase
VGDKPIFDVAVIGYGPVGKLLAILLAQAGRSVLIVERHPGIYPLPRATHLSFEAMRIFDAAGLGDAMAAISHPKRDEETQASWLAADRTVLFKTPPMGSEIGTWPIFNIFNQPELEERLHQRVEQFGNVVFQRGWAATALVDAGDCAELTCHCAADGREECFRAEYVVGCDGANSFVRQTMAVEIENTGFEYHWLVVDLHLNERYTGPQYAGHVLDPARPLTFLTLGSTRHRFEFMLLAGETPEEMNTPERSWELVAPWGFDPRNATLDRHSVYAFRALWAKQWRKGRLLLAGDSAHLMPPFLGDGLCGGLRDAIALAWRFNMVLDGSASNLLFDSYTSERIPHIREVIETAVEHGKLICVTDPTAATQRDAFLRSVAPGLPPGLLPHARLGPGLLASSPVAGTLAPQGRVRFAGREGRFDELVGRGFCLLAKGFNPHDFLSPESRHFLAGIKATVAGIGEAESVVPCDDSYAAWFAAHAADAVLYRPDFNIFGTSDRAHINDLIDALRSGLTAGSGVSEVAMSSLT